MAKINVFTEQPHRNVETIEAGYLSVLLILWKAAAKDRDRVGHIIT